MLDMIGETASNTHWETADDYRGVLFRMERYRVAACRDGIQWLYQKRRANFKPGGTAWNTLGYFVTREALMRLHRAENGSDAPEIARLPVRFPREAGQ